MSHRGLTIGKILHLDESGAAVVDWDGNTDGPRRARSALGPRSAGDESKATVVLAFEANDPARPVILGFVHDALFAESPDPHAQAALEAPADLQIEARNSIEIRCGESSISLDRAGRVRVKGRQVVSRASGLHRIKGATVEIN